MEFPYNDEKMIYDYAKHRYVLTENGLREVGIDIDELTQDVIEKRAIFDKVSVMTYNYIHKHNANSLMQDYFIAKLPSARQIILEAMQQQAIYYIANGDLSISVDKEMRKMWFSPIAEDVLYKDVVELGCSILYSGTYRVYEKIDYEKDNF